MNVKPIALQSVYNFEIMYLIENSGGRGGGQQRKKNTARAVEHYIHRFATKLSMRINTNVKEIIVSGLQ